MKRKFMFLMDSLSTESQSLLRQKWKLSASSRKLVLDLDIDAKVLKFEGQQLALKADSFGIRCLKCFEGVQKVDIEDFVAQVFESKYNTSYQDRTRIAIQRFNKEISLFLGITKTFSLQKNWIVLDSSVEFKKRS
ncbi:MAG: hypothetical protein EOP04_25785 [Proteobacteria bacterium]|nr:MAG: hypothetical protein EOP04_25785 [Pseudomonadota bacterium]